LSDWIDQAAKPGRNPAGEDAKAPLVKPNDRLLTVRSAFARVSSRALMPMSRAARIRSVLSALSGPERQFPLEADWIGADT
jgi:hypothetical protein